jgi:tetratricopeptide (TPR) repeat protein
MQPALGARRLRAALQLLGDRTAPNPQPNPQPDPQPLRGRILVSLAHAEAEQGHIDLGWQLLAEAEPLLPPEQRGVLFGQRALIMRRTGRHDSSLPHFDAAVAALRGSAERADLARALLNRGVLHLDMGRLRLARADLQECIDAAAGHGFTRVLPMARHAMAYVDFLAGDIPAALHAYAAVAAEYTRVKPGVLPVLAVDRARALLAAGLYREADRELAFALGQFRRQRLTQDYAEAQLARAEVALLAGQPAVARRWAVRARTGFLRRHNSRWAALAALLALRAEQAAGGSAPLAGRARALAETLHGLGLAEDGLVAELVAVRALVRAGRSDEAERSLAAQRPQRPADRLDTRLLRRLARAEVATAAGRRAEASRQLTAGLAELQRHTSQLGCLDLQTGAAIHGRELAGSGLAAALRARSVAEVYRWAERTRAQALLLPPVRPAADPQAAATLEELRHLGSVLRSAELAGRPTDGLRARVATLRRTVREHAWTATGPRTAARMAPFAAVRAELADSAMVIYLRDGAALRALVVSAAPASLVLLGGFAAAEEALLRLRADLDAQAGRAMPSRLAGAVAEATRRDAAALAAAVLDPLLGIVGDRDLIVVPTGRLATVPWAVLPGCAGRPVTVAASASTWIARRGRLPTGAGSSTPAPALLVAGPGNDRGEAEVRAIAALRPHATVLTGQSASPAATLAALDGASVAHLAAHGRHEPDNALFSALELAGGPLLGYDLQRLGSAPAMVVLSSCDLGLSDVRPGDEALGMATALLSAGSSTVVASVSRVADEAAMAVMTGYHRAIGRGRPPAAALADAASPHLAGFVCFGAG